MRDDEPPGASRDLLGQAPAGVAGLGRDLGFVERVFAGLAPSDPPIRSRMRLRMAVGVVLYLAWTAWAIGLRVEHGIFAGLFLGLVAWSPKTARFAWLLLPFFGVGILYDNMRLFVGLRADTIHVADLYHAELSWFGVQGPSGLETLPEFLQRHTHPILDFLCGLAYITYLAQVFVIGLVFYVVDRERFTQLAWTFFWVNVAGIVTYLVYPAAPPWYVAAHGLGPAVLTAVPSAAGAARFDALIGVGLFESFYSRNANVFGAMPSLHCAYPTVVFLTARTRGWRWSVPCGLFAILVMFSAVYLNHHYLMDVVVGVAYAVAAFALVHVGRSVLRKRAHDPVRALVSPPAVFGQDR
ncbi:MAG: phosphatase PAP2 family protein [Deltaproteobacteria bacterium]|nr:phosphatase PAP2 family protein [Deltaproteobacteria bacterium]